MNRNEIARQYKRLKRFFPIFRFLEYNLWMFFPFLLIGLPLYVIANMVVPLIITIIWMSSVFILGYILAATFMRSNDIYDSLSCWIRSKLVLTNCIIRHFNEKWGMTYDQIESYVSHREKLGSNDSILYLLPFINQLCQLNKGAKEEQNTFLSACLSEDEIEDAFDKEYSDVQMEHSFQYWRGRDLGEMKALMNLLFQLTVEQDGIHNDEWKLLMQIMVQLKFNSRYIEYFKDRYYSLRTEFDDYKRNSTSSQGEYSTASLESYYAVLGVEKDASIEEIKRAYHELAMQHHPDLPKNANREEECEAKMMEINEAYEKVRRGEG